MLLNINIPGFDQLVDSPIAHSGETVVETSDLPFQPERPYEDDPKTDHMEEDDYFNREKPMIRVHGRFSLRPLAP